LKNIEDVEVWFLGMRKLFQLHNYTKNMKYRIVIFIVKGKVDIWWENVKCVRDITIKELSWHEFKTLHEELFFKDVL